MILLCLLEITTEYSTSRQCSEQTYYLFIIRLKTKTLKPLIQSLFYNKLTMFCNLLNAVLKVQRKKKLWLQRYRMLVMVQFISHAQFANPWTVACQASLSMGFSRQEYWSGLPFPSPGDLPDPGNKPRSPALQTDSLPTEL